MTRDGGEGEGGGDVDVVIVPTPMSWRTDLLFGVMVTAVGVAGAVFDVFPLWLIVMSAIIGGTWLALAVINSAFYGEGDNR